jgi:hypothetical protein
MAREYEVLRDCDEIEGYRLKLGMRLTVSDESLYYHGDIVLNAMVRRGYLRQAADG